MISANSVSLVRITGEEGKQDGEQGDLGEQDKRWEEDTV